MFEHAKINLMDLDEAELKEQELKSLRAKCKQLTELQKIHTTDIEHLFQHNDRLEKTCDENKKTIEALERQSSSLHEHNKGLTKDNEIMRQELDQVLSESVTLS